MPTQQTGFVNSTPSMEDVFRYFGDQTQQALQQTQSMQNPYANINDLGSAQSAFGLPTDVNASFNPARENLARGEARGMAGAALRAGNSATPERYFSNVGSQFADSRANLEGQAANAQIGNQRYNADFLRSLFQNKSAFDFQKMGLQSNLANSLLSGTQGFENSQYQNQDPNFGDYFMQALGSVGQIGGQRLKG